MKLTLTLAVVLAAAGIALAAVDSHNKEKQDQAAMPGPGPEHKVLELWAGNWDATVTMQTGAPQPEVSKATYTSRVGLGGRWLTGEFKGQMMGETFEGRDVLGYDQAKKSYVGTWIDSMSTSIMTSTGTWDAASQTLTMSGMGMDPASGKEVKHIMKTSFRGTDTMAFSILVEGAPGPMLSIEYKKKK